MSSAGTEHEQNTNRDLRDLSLLPIRVKLEDLQDVLLPPPPPIGDLHGGGTGEDFSGLIDNSEETCSDLESTLEFVNGVTVVSDPVNLDDFII
jgi:hypothetical protein